MKSRSIIIGVLSIASLAAGVVAHAREVQIKREALPAAVNAALQSRYPGAEILGITEEKEKGTVLYDVEMKVSGRRVDVLLQPNGTLHEEGSEITANELPAKVREAHARSAQAKWTIDGAERLITTNPSTTRFEVRVSDGKRHMELVYGVDGKPLSSTQVKAGEDEEEDEDEGDD